MSNGPTTFCCRSATLAGTQNLYKQRPLDKRCGVSHAAFAMQLYVAQDVLTLNESSGFTILILVDGTS